MTLIQRCIELFQLLPTSGYRWLIAADWLEEKGAEVEAAAFREGLGESKQPSLDMGGAWHNCYGYGLSSGHGVGALDGFGDGDGNGYGGGDRGGCGGNRTNYGYGFADGAGDGNGTGGDLFRL